MQETTTVTRVTISDTKTHELFYFFFSYACRKPQLVSYETASSFAECSRNKLPFSCTDNRDTTIVTTAKVVRQLYDMT